MKKLMLAALCATIMVSCDPSNSKKAAKNNEALKKENEALKLENSQKEEEYNELVTLITQVQDGLIQISEAEHRVVVANTNPEGVNAREQILENMLFIQESMQQYRSMIQQLENRLKSSSVDVSSLNNTLNKLRAQMEEQEQSIQELENQLAEKDSLIMQQGDQIDALNEENKQKNETLDKQTSELNTAWYVFGTRAELKEQKILQDGQVLTNSDFNQDYFTQMDIRALKEIPLESKKAKLLTNHPDHSYILQADDNNNKYLTLKIVDPASFWSVSKYLVVQVY